MNKIKMHKLKNLAQLMVFTLMISLLSCGEEQYPELEDGLYAEIVTSKGTMVANLEFEKTPVTVANFVALAEGVHPMVKEEYKDKKYYNGLTFHRVMDKFMIQGGDPDASGRGGPGFKFEDEFHPDLAHDKVGVLSMANPGPNSNGSQFFIIETPQPHLDNVHSVFGELVLGEDVLDSISTVKVAQGNKPVEDVIMQQVNIIRKGSAAKKFDAPKVFNEELPKIKEKQAQIQEEKKNKAEEEFNARMKMNEDAGKPKVSVFEDYKKKGQATSTGLIIHYLQKGTGSKPNTADKVLVDYEGYFIDGRLFDTSLEGIAEQHGMINKMKQQRGLYKPMEMPMSPDAGLMAGFKEAVASMRVGDKAFFYIPSHLAYGESGYGPNGEIPPNTDLIFLIHLKEIL